MLTITVAQDGSGHFATIGEAVQAVPYDTPARILIGPGTYREKLSCAKRDTTLQGAGMTQTRLVWNDGGKLRPPARKRTGERRLPGPAGIRPSAGQRPVLPGLPDHRGHRLHLWRCGRPV